MVLLRFERLNSSLYEHFINISTMHNIATELSFYRDNNVKDFTICERGNITFLNFISLTTYLYLE